MAFTHCFALVICLTIGTLACDPPTLPKQWVMDEIDYQIDIFNQTLSVTKETNFWDSVAKKVRSDIYNNLSDKYPSHMIIYNFTSSTVPPSDARQYTVSIDPATGEVQDCKFHALVLPFENTFFDSGYLKDCVDLGIFIQYLLC
jgi:hypothetical protein